MRRAVIVRNEELGFVVALWMRCIICDLLSDHVSIALRGNVVDELTVRGGGKQIITIIFNLKEQLIKRLRTIQFYTL